MRSQTDKGSGRILISHVCRFPPDKKKPVPLASAPPAKHQLVQAQS